MWKKKPTAVETLLQYGAEPTLKRNGDTPFLWALKNDHQNIFYLLINEITLMESDAIGLLPIQIAAHKGYTEIAEFLLNYAKNFNLEIVDLHKKDEYTALHLAILNNHPDVVKTLLNHHANVSILGKHGFSTFHYAAQVGKSTIVKYLLENNKASTELINLPLANGDTALYIAVFNGHRETVKMLLDSGADPDTLNINQETPLMLAQKLSDRVIEEMICIAIKNKRPDLNQDPTCNM